MLRAIALALRDFMLRAIALALRASEQTWDLQSAGHAAKLSGQRLVNFANTFVDCRDNQILQHVLVSAGENFGVDLD